MITLVEFAALENNQILQDRVTSACRLECKEIFTEEETLAEHVRRLKWAIMILRDDGTGQAVMSIFRAVLVFVSLTPAYDTILKIEDDTIVTDDVIRTAVKSIIKHFAIVGI